MNSRKPPSKADMKILRKLPASTKEDLGYAMNAIAVDDWHGIEEDHDFYHEIRLAIYGDIKSFIHENLKGAPEGHRNTTVGDMLSLYHAVMLKPATPHLRVVK